MEPQVNNSAYVTPREVGIRFGLIGAVISIIYFIILNLAGLDMTQGFWNWLGYVITLVLLVLSHKYYKDKGDGFMSYGQGIGIAFWIGIVSGLLGSIFNYFYIKFIDPAFLEIIKDKQLEAMQERGMSDDQIDQAMQFSSIFMTAEAMLFFMFFGSILATILFALIVTIFTQKRNPAPAF